MISYNLSRPLHNKGEVTMFASRPACHLGRDWYEKNSFLSNSCFRQRNRLMIKCPQYHIYKCQNDRPVEVGGLKPPNKFENNGVTSQELIRCIVLYCFKNPISSCFLQCCQIMITFWKISEKSVC